MRNILVCNCVKKKMKIFQALQDYLKNRFRDNFKLLTTEEYNKKSQIERTDFWTNLRFVCFHTNTSDLDLFKDAFEEGIPIVLVRDITDKGLDERWCRLFEELGVVKQQKADLESVKERICMISQVSQIQGAVKWVTDYYHPLKDKAVEMTQKYKEAEARWVGGSGQVQG